VLTSAGAAAGIDLSLHLVERDFGAAVAADTARRSVVPLRRDGGQAQFLERDLGMERSSALEPTLEWMARHAHERLTVAMIAGHAHLSVRTLSRRFRDELDVSPGEYLARLRVRRALALLETTHDDVSSVAAASGFGRSANLRARLKRDVQTAPTKYRSHFAETVRDR
jgi:transcriptional regulator GlxA family with amidase domain